MAGEKDLAILLKTMKPEHQEGDYVFCTLSDLSVLKNDEIFLIFKEKEGITVIVKQEIADKHQIPYSFVAAWITLTVHSALEAVGLTAAFSKALADNGIGCNVVAAFYHDHIFVAKDDLEKAMAALSNIATFESYTTDIGY